MKSKDGVGREGRGEITIKSGVGQDEIQNSSRKTGSYEFKKTVWEGRDGVKLGYKWGSSE